MDVFYLCIFKENHSPSSDAEGAFSNSLLPLIDRQQCFEDSLQSHRTSDGTRREGRV